MTESTHGKALAEAILAYFDETLDYHYPRHKKQIDELVQAMRAGNSAVQAQLNFDAGGVTSIEFFELREGEEPRPLVKSFARPDVEH